MTLVSKIFYNYYKTEIKMINKIIVSSLIIISMITFTDNVLLSQGSKEIENILNDFKQYRFGAVNIYQLDNAYELNELLVPKKQTEGKVVITDDEEKIIQDLKESKPLAYNTINSQVIRKQPYNTDKENVIINELDKSGISIVYNMNDNNEYTIMIDQIKLIYNYEFAKIKDESEEAQKLFYAVTTKPEQVGENPKNIIGVIIIDEDENSTFEEMMKSGGLVYSYRALQDSVIDKAKYGYETIYDLTYSYFIQGSVKNKTIEARGIGTDIRYFDEQVGVASSLIKYNYSGVGNSDIQTFKRVSNGEPQKYIGSNQEILVSLDKIRWLLYPEISKVEVITYKVDEFGLELYDSLGERIILKKEYVDDKLNYSNYNLPKLGFELGYGAEDINMPSFSSERLSLSAIWGKVKLGAILPTAGWSNLQTDLFDINRKMTHGGFGVVGEFDFDFPIIPKSDVFRMSFGYTFGDPVSPDYGAKNIGSMIDDNPVANSNLVGDNRNNDYMLRVNSTLQYTFGLSIDDDYLLRLGIGGSFYSMENWRYRVMNDENNIPSASEYYKDNSELVGGLSAKIDFMVQNVNTPYGATVNYFDETINLNLFVQFPVVDNMLYLKLKANGNIILREFDRPWENGSFFMPMINVIYVF